MAKGFGSKSGTRGAFGTSSRTPPFKIPKPPRGAVAASGDVQPKPPKAPPFNGGSGRPPKGGLAL